MSNPNDYTILWICALTTEYVAAQTFLDEEDPKPEAGTIAISDTNAYTLGRISGHRVVLAVLPKGEYGLGSASSVITNILRSFSMIKIGLMVGIGGGAPTKANDIRLGDVVVSSPKDGRGGVYHYDLGKETQDSGFRQTGFLDQPPTVIRTAVSALESKHIRKGHNIIENIKAALKENPRLKKRGYACPDSESDRLYKSDVVHPDQEESCKACCGAEPNNLITRQPRDDEVDNPAIHYGLIGSGNKVIKNAILRDKLAKEEGVLCFEMEAAGIMNRFPCLVVRGICDYSDSHKNKQWQGYAAMTAAAYTKELLMELSSQGVEREERLAVAIERLSSDVQNVAASIEQLRTSHASDAVTRWLKAADPSVNYMAAIEIHRTGTGEWFLHSAQFQDWKDKLKSFLWLHGMSGCGKTILSAAIIESLLNEQGCPIIYFYFDFSDSNKQHYKDMLRSMLLQLYHKLPIAQAIIQDCYNSHEQGHRQPTSDQLKDTLASVFEKSQGVDIILDALDEAHSVDEIVQWCRSIHGAEALKVRLLVTSRTQVVNWSYEEDLIPLQSQDLDEDIKFYTRRRLHSEEFEHWKTQETLRDEVETTICDKAKGMFRWAALQLDNLRKCLNRPAIEKALRDLPTTLNDTYARMLTSIQMTAYSREVTVVLQMLMWCNERPTIEACNDAITVQPEEQPGFSINHRFFDPRGIIRVCAGLVTTNRYTYLQLAHASVREYLLSEEVIQPFQSHLAETVARTDLLRMCHTYLCCVDWSIDRFSLEKEFPLAYWARSTWLAHARYLDAIGEETSVLDCLRQASELAEYSFEYSIEPFYWGDKTQCYPLYLAALVGLRRSCARLVQLEVDICSSGSHFENDTRAVWAIGKVCGLGVVGLKQMDMVSSASQIRLDASLLAASSGGHDEIVQDLLVHGARPDALRFWRRRKEYTALYPASRLGHTEVVRLLIRGGAAVDFKDGPFGKTALTVASENGHVDVVEVLLAGNADPNLCSDGCSPLRTAVIAGHVAVAQALINAGARLADQSFISFPELRNHTALWRLRGKRLDKSTLLMLATLQEDERMVQILLDHDVSTEDMDDYNQTVLHLAATWCGTTVIKLLLDHHASVDALGPQGIPLTVAARSGRHNVVKILLDYDNDLRKCRWHDPVLVAASKEHYMIVHEILLRVAHIDESGPRGTALYQAAQKDLGKLVEILLQHKALVDEHVEGMGTPLQIATGKLHLRVMRLLITGGANVNEDGGSEYFPPWIAFSMVSFTKSQIRKLQELQSYPDSIVWKATDGRYWTTADILSRALTPLQIAVLMGSEEAVELLLDGGADVNKGQRFPPQSGVRMIDVDFMQKILGDCVCLVTSGPLIELATVLKRRSIIEQLIGRAAAAAGDDEVEHSPIQLASIAGHPRIVQMLLCYGYKCTTQALHWPRTNVTARRQLRSALTIAVYAKEIGYDNYQAVGLLLRQGLLDKTDLKPALLHAVQFDYRNYVHQLLVHGLDVDEVRFSYRYDSIDDTTRTAEYTLLRVAAVYGRDAIVRLLLYRGADINDKHHGICALAVAAAAMEERTMRLLIRRGADIELAIEGAWGLADAKKIARRLRRLQKLASDQFSEWEEDASLHLLDSDCPQLAGE